MNAPFFTAWPEASRAYFGPALRWQEIAADAAQKLVQYQLAVSRDALDYGGRQWELLGTAQEPQKIVLESSRNAADFSRKLAERGGEFLRIAKDTQDAVTAWADATAKAAVEGFAKPADAA